MNEENLQSAIELKKQIESAKNQLLLWEKSNLENNKGHHVYIPDGDGNNKGVTCLNAFIAFRAINIHHFKSLIETLEAQFKAL